MLPPSSAKSSETVISYSNTILHHNPEDLNLHLHCHGYLKSHSSVHIYPLNDQLFNNIIYMGCRHLSKSPVS